MEKQYYELYSGACRRALAVTSKREFDERAKVDRLEQFGETAYNCRYTRMRKLKKGKNADLENAVLLKAALDAFRAKGERILIMMRNPEQTIGNLIDKQGVAFIGSVDAGGFPNIKAMLPPRKREGIKLFWFTTNTSSMRVEQYRENANACIYFLDKRFFRGVQLVGTMEIMEDSATKESIWRDGDMMYYPGGVTDPDYCVLRFTAQSGRYYSNFNSEDFKFE